MVPEIYRPTVNQFNELPYFKYGVWIAQNVRVIFNVLH